MTNITTMEKLAREIRPCYDAMIKVGEHVFLAKSHHRGGHQAKVYEFIDLDDAPSTIEARISLTEASDECFEDSGDAILWCMDNV